MLRWSNIVKNAGKSLPLGLRKALGLLLVIVGFNSISFAGAASESGFFPVLSLQVGFFLLVI